MTPRSLLGLGLGLVVLLGACGPETVDDEELAADDPAVIADEQASGDATSREPFSGHPHVWIVGDSLAVGAGNAAWSLMGGRYSLTVRAKVGDTIMGRYPEVLNAVHSRADAIVIQAGINDVGSGVAHVSQLAKDIGRTLSATAGTRCVFWATYQTVFHHGYPKLNSSAPALDRVIRAEVAKRPKWAHVVEFQPYIDAHPSLNGPDGLHLTTKGYKALASYYSAGLKHCFGF